MWPRSPISATTELLFDLLWICRTTSCATKSTTDLRQIKPGTERVQALADISRSRYVVTATKPVRRLQIRPIVHKYVAPLPFPKLHPGPCSSVGTRPRTGRHRQTHVTNIHFASSTTHAKCNKRSLTFTDWISCFNSF